MLLYAGRSRKRFGPAIVVAVRLVTQTQGGERMVPETTRSAHADCSGQPLHALWHWQKASGWRPEAPRGLRDRARERGTGHTPKLSEAASGRNAIPIPTIL